MRINPSRALRELEARMERSRKDETEGFSRRVYTNHDHSGGGYPVLHRAMHDDLEVRVIDLAPMKFHPPASKDVNRVSLHVMVTDENVERFLGGIQEVAKEAKA